MKHSELVERVAAIKELRKIAVDDLSRAETRIIQLDRKLRATTDALIATSPLTPEVKP